MRVLVSGATGLIGSAVADVLSAQHEVISLGRGDSAVMRCDLSSLESIRSIDFSGIDAVVHCAGVVDEDFRDDVSAAFYRATVAMEAFVSNARASGVRRFAYVSSAHVYGRLEGKINENSAPNPLSNYAIAHFATEQIIRRMVRADFRAVAVRPCAVFGLPSDLAAFQRWTLIPFDFPRSAAAEGRIVLKSFGDQFRNFVGTRDIAQSVSGWLQDANNPDYAVINPIGKENMSVWQFAQLCADIAERVTGHPISLARTEGASGGPRLEYETVYSNHHGRQDLRETITALTELLWKRKDQMPRL